MTDRKSRWPGSLGARLGLLVVLVATPLAASRWAQQERQRGGRGDGVDDLELGSDRGVDRSTLPSLGGSVELGGASEFQDRPVVAGGSQWLLFLESRPLEGDSLRAANLADANPRIEATGVENAQLVDLSAVTDGRSIVHAVWCDVSSGHAALFHSQRGADGWTAAKRLVGDATRPARSPACAVDGRGRAWLAYSQYAPQTESSRGRWTLRLRMLDESESEVVADDGAPPDFLVDDSADSARDPALAGAGDLLWLAWSQSDLRDAEIALAPFDVDTRTLGSIENLSRDPLADDLHPSIACDKEGRPWVAFDSIRSPQRGSSWPRPEHGPRGPETEAVRLLCWDNGQPRAPHGFPRGELPVPLGLSQSGGRPRLRFSPTGQLVLVHRFRHVDRTGLGKNYSFPVVVHRHTDEGWSEAAWLESSDGEGQEVALAFTDRNCTLAWQSDQRLDSTRSRRRVSDEQKVLAARGAELSLSHAPSRIRRTSLATAAETAPPPLSDETFSLPEETRWHPLGEVESDPLLRSDSHFVIENGEERYRVYFGDLHRHSHDSRCSTGYEPDPRDRYRYGRDFLGFDFVALTEHCGQVDPLQWWRACKLLDAERSADYCTLQGFEWSTREGHYNVVLRGRTDRIRSNGWPGAGSFRGLWEGLSPDDAITIPHHTAATSNGVEWNRRDASKVVLAEVFQALRGSYEFGGCYRQARSGIADGQYLHDALELGFRFGMVASTDHGSGAAYAAVLAESLDRQSLFDALLARRTYASTTKGIYLEFRVDGKLMGGNVLRRERDPLPVTLRVEGGAELAEVRIYRNGEPWRTIGRSGITDHSRHPLTLRVDVQRDSAPPPPLRLRLERGRIESARRRDLPEGPMAEIRSGFWRDEDGSVVYQEGAERSEDVVPVNRRIRLLAPGEAVLHVEGASEPQQTTLAELRRGELRVGYAGGSFTLRAHGAADADVDCSVGMGTSAFEESWQDESPRAGANWYSARVIRTDGEIAWSSPVFVRWPRD